MQTAVKLYEALYVSTQAPDAGPGSVAEIVRTARIANAANDITGLLIFDGMRYSQQIEGPRNAVLALMELIRVDPRHVNVEILHHGSLDKRRFRAFSMGYTAADDPDLLERLEKLDGQAAVDAFMALRSHADVM